MEAIVRDVNGDGINDIIKITDTAIGSEGTVGVYLGNADGSFSIPSAAYITGNSGQAIIGDFNRDGILDVATGTGSNNTGTTVLFGNSDGTFNAGVTYALDTTSDLKTADINGDGILDLIGSSSAGQVRVALGNSNGTFAAPISYASLANTTEILIEDVNRDGRLDIAGISSDGKLVLLSGNGTGSFGATTTTVYEYTWGQVAKRAIGPEDPTDPTAKLTIKNRAEASLTVSVLDKILDRIRRDITGVDEILEELNGAFRFAQAGIVALQRTVSSGSATTPDGIAQSLIKQIRELTRDNAISAHSDIDSFLAKELLGS